MQLSTEIGFENIQTVIITVLGQVTLFLAVTSTASGMVTELDCISIPHNI